MFVMLLRGAGIISYSEPHTSKGRADVVIKFNEFVEPILNTVYNLAKANQNLAIQRDLLLPRLMSGKLEVK